MVKIREAIVVEGRYDKNTLSQLVDAPIFEKTQNWPPSHSIIHLRIQAVLQIFGLCWGLARY